MKEYIKKVSEGENLSPGEAEDAMKLIMGGESTGAQNGAFLVALSIKGETVEEIAAFARVMRKYAAGIKPKVDGTLVDVCGTGGDGKHTFNISTTAMFVAAGAGVPIAKHGNRSITSNCGSADLLEALGARIDLKPEDVAGCIEETGVGFMFAPLHHPAMKHVMPARKEIGIRSVFNILGPLTNPANAEAQLMGVFDPALTEKLAEVFKALGLKHALVVHGEPGLDEISTLGDTKIAEMKDGEVHSFYLSPESLKIRRATLKDISGGTPQENAKTAKRILAGKSPGPLTEIVLLNAAGGIIVGGLAGDFREGLAIARDSLGSGRALERMDAFIRYTRDNGPGG